jgi:hypothetical protein
LAYLSIHPIYLTSQHLQFLFFALFSIIGKTSSFVGPFVSSAIIDDSGNTNMPFTFLLALGTVSVGILWCVNVDKSRVECRRYLEDEAIRVYQLSLGELGVGNRNVEGGHGAINGDLGVEGFGGGEGRDGMAGGRRRVGAFVEEEGKGQDN